MAAETASIEIERTADAFVDGLRAYKVVVDGEDFGRIRAGDFCVFEVSPGPHELFLTIDWARSESMNFQLAPGETARFHCRPRANVLTDLYWASFGRRRYVKLTRVTS
jgi:hypothetical protein